MNYKLSILFILITSLTYAQFGVEVGYSLSEIKITPGNDTSDTNGFTIGAVHDHELSENLDLQSGLGLQFLDKIGKESNTLLALSTELQYYLAGRDSGFFALVGPQYTFRFNDIENVKKGAFNAGLGLGYDFSEQFSFKATYLTQLSDYSDSKVYEMKRSGINLGLQYFF
jgi:hypothetical protein